ncbi:MAG: cytochrome b [Xanthomonadales bacterium]|nr:cytochrome b [Xanthomonadales bacterium]
MPMKNTLDRYGSLSIAMHWLMLALLVAVYSTILLREVYPKGSDPRDALKMWHFMLGLSVFALVFVRIGLRFFGTTPRIVPPPPKWQHLLSIGMNLALYVFLIAMPLLGWLTLSAAGKPIPFFGLELPALLPQDKEFSHTLEDVHTTIGEIGYYLIGAHALAGLFHHYIVHDNALLRMLPDRSV